MATDLIENQTEISSPETSEHWLAPEPSLTDKLRISGNIAIHNFGSPYFWNEMLHPETTETSEGVSEVRVLNRHLIGAPEANEVVLLPALGTSSAGGHNAEVANFFAENGFIVWMPSSIGFEGEVNRQSYLNRSIRTVSKHFDDAVYQTRERFGVSKPIQNIFGSSQGGGSAIGVAYRMVQRGEKAPKVVAETPCSGDNAFNPHRLGRLGVQFLVKEPVAVGQHLLKQKNPVRRALSLAGSVNLQPRAIINTVTSGIGIVAGPDHAKAFETELFDPDRVVIIRYDDDIVASDEYPEEVVTHYGGVHMQILGTSARKMAVEFFRDSQVQDDQLFAA